MLCLNALELNLIKDLLKHKVRFLIVGGHAVIYHGHVRLTKDIDFLVDSSDANVDSLMRAVDSFCMFTKPSEIKKFSGPFRQIRINGMGLHVDLITTIQGMDFETVYDRRVNIYKDGVTVPIMSFNDLVESKRIAGRPQDAEDIRQLEVLALKTSANPDA